MAANHPPSIDRNNFLAMPPPRQVPLSVIKAAAPLGGMVSLMLIGTVFLVLGLVMCWAFVPSHLPSQWQLDHGSVLTVAGKITSAEDTKTSVNSQRVREYRFSYQPDSGGKRHGTAFTTGSRWSQGAAVTVRYLAADPAVAVPAGARLDEAPAWLLFVLLFPLTGCGLMLNAIFSRRKKLQLLRDGRLTTATVSSIEKTRVEVNNRPQFKIHLIRSDDRSAIMKRSCDPTELAWADEKIKSAEPVKLLYDPKNPKHFLFPETWEA